MSWCLRFLSYEVHTLWAWRDAAFWVHFDAFHLLCHWDVCWQPKRVEAPLQISLGAFKVYFVFLLYSRLTAVIFLLSFGYYYWPWVHFLTQTGWGLFVAIPFPHHISRLKRDPTAGISVSPDWKRGKTHPAVPLSPCHRQPSSLAPAGPCSWEAMEMGTRGTAMCLRDRQDHHLLSQGAPVQPLVVDQATPVSHRPDGPLMAHCWWRGVMSSAQAHPAGAALQSHASLQGLSGLLHARKAPRDLVTPACPLSPFPLFSSPKV